MFHHFSPSSPICHSLTYTNITPLSDGCERVPCQARDDGRTSRRCETRIRRAIARAHRSGFVFTLCVFGLDAFGNVFFLRLVNTQDDPRIPIGVFNNKLYRKYSMQYNPISFHSLRVSVSLITLCSKFPLHSTSSPLSLLSSLPAGCSPHSY
jgi:hypothetical protein